MRVLITHHFSLDDSPSGRSARHWATALMAAGHEVHALVVDDDRQDHETFPVRRVICCPGDPHADIPLDVPRFAEPSGTERSSCQTFEALTDRQLALYREVLRRYLDVEVDQFNPHVIHAQHLWLLGQLALETGVPYVLSFWGPELAGYAADERYRALVDQAVDNAGRILVSNEQSARKLAELFETAAPRTLVAPLVNETCDWPAAARWISGVYETVLAERFGRASM